MAHPKDNDGGALRPNPTTDVGSGPGGVSPASRTGDTLVTPQPALTELTAGPSGQPGAAPRYYPEKP
jgi:hypothetical protein